MSSFYAELTLDGQTPYPLRQCQFEFTQATDQRGRAATKVRHGLLQLTLDVPENDQLLDWANTVHKPLAGHVTFFEDDRRTARETLSFAAGQCVSYQETFVAGDAEAGAYVCQLIITSDGLTLAPGGAAQAFAAPAARDHGGPAVAAAVAVASGLRNMAMGGVMAAGQVTAPFVVGADGVPRLPLITGDPPFKCKGAERGKKGKPDKPALDPIEFERQLTGQQEGMNKLTVAAFLANRDQYIKTSKENKAKQNKNGGRNLKEGNPAQELARQKAFKAKVAELRRQDRSLTKGQAEIDANNWLETQAALHDPDQVAGGYATHITGMGDGRVNYAIGGGWPSRIKAIDQQIRAYAKNMTPEEQQTTYLNIVLPFTKPLV